jgi:predicted transposase/invertase (TIGR01784 family)
MTAQKGIKRLDPLNDYLFLKVMGEKGDEKQLLSFLNAVLGRTDKNSLKSVEIIESHKITAEITKKKDSILDLRATIGNNTNVNIEVQLRSMRELGNIIDRSLYYWSRDFSTSLDSGHNYNKLPRTIIINIVNYELLKGFDEFHANFLMHENNHHGVIATTILELHVIDMVKFRRLKDKDIKNNPLHRWLAYLDKNTNLNIIKEIIEMDTAIQEAEKRIQYVLSDKEAFMAYTNRQIALSDYNTGVENATIKGVKRGVKKGRKEGEEKAKVEVAKKLKELDVPLTKIQESTGLSIEEIEQL